MDYFPGHSPIATNVTGTCHTPGCTNAGERIFIANLYGLLWCGGCDTEITDITKETPWPKPSSGT